MTTSKLSDEAFLAILTAHPELRDRFVSIARAVLDSDGDLKEADTAEERIVEEMRLLGRVTMQGWADHQVELTEREIRQQPQMHRQGKKNSAGIRNSAKSRS
jgi:DNA repair protein RadC